MQALILAFPDFTKEFILDTDASFDRIGAVLSQLDEYGNEKVIAYCSHAMKLVIVLLEKNCWQFITSNYISNTIFTENVSEFERTTRLLLS